MNEKLLQLATDKGFFDNFFIYQGDYYLWLCNLQKWLREKYAIHVFIYPEVQTTNKMESLGGNIWYFDKHWCILRYDHSAEYTDILETLLDNALQLIKNE
jgi:hypothetical protein